MSMAIPGTGETTTSDYWSEDGDVLVHESRSGPIGWLLIFAALVGAFFFATSKPLVGILGNLVLWSIFGLQLLSYVEREEFDRRSRTMRQRGLFGRSWTESFDRFAGIQVVRGYSGRGSPQIRVSVERCQVLGKRLAPEYVVAIYPFPTAADESEAREWGDRLARFVELPLRLEL
jgi:hypothetical protein